MLIQIIKFRLRAVIQTNKLNKDVYKQRINIHSENMTSFTIIVLVFTRPEIVILCKEKFTLLKH